VFTQKNLTLSKAVHYVLELISDPVFTSLLEKQKLASQPTMSRFMNRCDDICLMQFEYIHEELRRRIYSINKPQSILLDIDSTLFATYGKQEGNDYNQHYSNYGYHPLLVFDGLTGDLLKSKMLIYHKNFAEIRNLQEYKRIKNS
jgi:hypothetical protein